MWFCSLCLRSRSFVLAAKFATLEGLQVGDLCSQCLREKAEKDIAMEKCDDIGIGYTQAVMDEGWLPLMFCKYCKRWRSVMLLPKDSLMCPSCVQVMMSYG
jgi:hypothetical protein